MRDGIAVTPAPPTSASAIFDVKAAFGAKGDGISDDQPAIQAAVRACEDAGGGTVFLPRGTYFMGSGGACVLTPDNAGTRAWVRIMFDAGAKMRLSSSCPGAFWLTRLADYDTFQKIEIVGAEVDVDNVVGASASAVIGLPTTANGSNRVNYADIRIVDAHIYNLPAHQPTFIRAGIWLDSYQPGDPGWPEAVQQTVERVWVIRPRIYGGDIGVNISARPASLSAPTGTNCYFDDIHVIDPIVELNNGAPPATALSQSGIILANSGYGGKCRVSNAVVKYSGDVGIEIDAFTDTVVANPETTDCGIGVYCNNFHAAEDVARQRFIVENPRHRVTAAWAPGIVSNGVKISTANPFGALFVRNQRYDSAGQVDSASPFTSGLALKTSGSIRRIEIDGFRAEVTAAIFDKATLMTTGVLDITTSYVGAIASLRRIDGQIAGNRSGAGGLNLRMFAIRGASIDLQIDGVGFGSSITNASTSTHHAICIGETTATTVIGSISGVVARAFGSDVDPRAVRFFAGTTITGVFPITHVNLAAMGGGSNDIVTSDATNRAKLRLTENSYVNTKLTVPSAATLTIPDAPVIEISGTTSITSVTALPKIGGPVVLKFTGVLTVTHGSNIVLAGGANFVTAANSTLTLVCDGANWIEVARKA